ncbi:cyclin-domain-containing protein [Periconia macrospinosa]|uniref:Cyclin-domain-containing protein n=1 Tax=Periconia macrospinosa TaxID=97972 RepID=A0A2V1DQQ2_9PLEO|nr:cyclin-domain-containing protein [Periconia macrospinosa]
MPVQLEPTIPVIEDATTLKNVLPISGQNLIRVVGYGSCVKRAGAHLVMRIPLVGRQWRDGCTDYGPQTRRRARCRCPLVIIVPFFPPSPSARLVWSGLAPVGCFLVVQHAQPRRPSSPTTPSQPTLVAPSQLGARKIPFAAAQRIAAHPNCDHHRPSLSNVLTSSRCRCRCRSRSAPPLRSLPGMLTSSSPTFSAPPSPSSAFHNSNPHPHSRSSYHASKRPRSPRFTVTSAQRSPLAPSPSTKRKTYQDSGTQYSPQGYPPTYRAPHADQSAALQSLPAPSTFTSQAERGATSAALTATEPPEPQLRIDPQPVALAQHAPPGTRASTGSRESRQPREETQGAEGGDPVVDEDEDEDEDQDEDGKEEGQRSHQRLRSSLSGTLMPQSSPAKKPRSSNQNVKVMPLQYETCDVKDLGVLISDMLMELVRLNDEFPLRDGQLTRFHSRAPPAISVRDYLVRLIVHATLSPPILLSMVFYVDKLCTMYPAFTISSLTVHRFLITAATVAAKGLSDSFWTNSLYAKVGGVSLRELALLEVEFLKRLEWRIVPKPETLVDYYKGLVERGQGYVLEKVPEAAPAKVDPSVAAKDQKAPIASGDTGEVPDRP